MSNKNEIYVNFAYGVLAAVVFLAFLHYFTFCMVGKVP